MLERKDVQRACAQVGDAITNVVNLQDSGVDAVSASMATSMAALSMTASLLMEGFNPHKNRVPTPDHFLFAAMLIWDSCHLEGCGKLKVTFSPEAVLTAIENYEKFTGQSPRPILSQSMLKALDRETKIDRTSFGENAKFLPH